MAEIGDREARLEATIGRIFDCLDRIDASQTRIEGQLDRVETGLGTTGAELARLSGRIEVFSSRWTILTVMMSIAAGLFIGLTGVVLALYRTSS